MLPWVGYQVHRIRGPQDLTAAMARQQARNGWLTDNQYLAILANPHQYQGLVVQELPPERDEILNGQRECLFMVAQGVVDPFDFVIEETNSVKFGNEWRLTVKLNYDQVFEKREYTMRNNYEYKLVHCRPNDDPAKIDKVRARLALQQLGTAIMNHGQTSRDTKEGLLHNIRGRGRGGRGGGASGST